MKTKQVNRRRILSFNRQRRKQQGGQMAIFVVLIFQVLFVFFAMALNVALVVHDKINLQNSADLAALYGAQKQAEVLNVLAHINFQMRQNFKLLTWRYRVLGSIIYRGDLGNRPPSDSSKPPLSGDYWCPYALHSSGGSPPGPINGSYGYCKPPYPYPSSSPPPNPCGTFVYPNQYCDANYFVCISSTIWYRGDTIDVATNHCKHLDEVLQAVVPFPVISGNPLASAVSTLLNQNLNLAAQLNRKCDKEGFYNWLITQMFLGHFRLDQKDRKAMIHTIYHKTLEEGKDLDGNPIQKGMQETFQKNLTYTNKTNFKNNTTALEVFYSSKGKAFAEFFTPINIYPMLEYLDFPDGTPGTPGTLSNSCGKSRRRSHFKLPKKGVRPDDPNIEQFVNDWRWLFDLSTDEQTRGSTHIMPIDPALPPPISNYEQFIDPLTLAYERTDNIFYSGVSVAVNYDSAFPLFFPGLSGGGNLQLKASSFAKPFGGRIGPKKDKQDPLINHIITPFSTPPPLNPYHLKPNYSRYPGDKWGLIHREAHEQYYLQKPHGTGFTMPSIVPYDIMYFSHLYGGDPLAYSGAEEKYLFVRMMELMAVAPDLYDMTYYSPLNHYMTAYFPRICYLLTGNDCSDGNRAIQFGTVPGGNLPAYIRGDFGFPYTKDYSDKNKNEIGVSSPLSTFYFNLGKTGFQIAHLPQYPRYINRRVAPWLVNDPAHFLTAWVPTPTMERYDDYAFPTDIFGKCRAVAKEGEPVPSGCVTGGRAGYSVKLVSCEMAKTFSPAPSSTIACP